MIMYSRKRTRRGDLPARVRCDGGPGAKGAGVADIDHGAPTMATVPAARERSTTTAARKRPVAPARRGETHQRLGQLFKLVGQPTRLRLLLALANGPKSTRQIFESLG